MAAIGAAADTSVRRREADATRARPNRQGAEEVQALKARDNLTNWKHLARIYLVIAAAVAGAVWMIEASRAGEVSWWWTVPATIVAIITIGASQHQFGGAIHEGTHYMLVANRKFNELASRLVRGFSYPDDNLSLPAAPPRAPSVRQRPRTRSGHQPAA
jgi:fatty acid desaturase